MKSFCENKFCLFLARTEFMRSLPLCHWANNLNLSLENTFVNTWAGFEYQKPHLVSIGPSTITLYANLFCQLHYVSCARTFVNVPSWPHLWQSPSFLSQYFCLIESQRATRVPEACTMAVLSVLCLLSFVLSVFERLAGVRHCPWMLGFRRLGAANLW